MSGGVNNARSFIIHTIIVILIMEQREEWKEKDAKVERCTCEHLYC